ncbi:RING-type domain-containing protein [Pycnococcus provasolii]
MAGSAAAAAAPFSSRRGSTYGRNIRSTASRILVVEEEEEEPPSSSSFSNAHPGRPFFTAMAMARAHVAALYRTCCLCCSDVDDDLVHEYDDYADAYENDERERLLEGEDTALLAAHRQTEARLRASPSTSSASSADCDVHNAEAGAGRGVADPQSAAIDGAGAAAAHPAPAPPPRTLSAVSVDDPDALACPTCLESYTSENPRINTACGHHYHLSCIYEWSERSDLCPICQRPMQDEHGEPFW